MRVEQLLTMPQRYTSPQQRGASHGGPSAISLARRRAASLPSAAMLASRRAALCLLFASACGSAQLPAWVAASADYRAVEAPLPRGYCTAKVQGRGLRDTETDYIPRVIRCENGGANLEALKAQAIAARSVLYYNMATS